MKETVAKKAVKEDVKEDVKEVVKGDQKSVQKRSLSVDDLWDLIDQDQFGDLHHNLHLIPMHLFYSRLHCAPTPPLMLCPVQRTPVNNPASCRSVQIGQQYSIKATDPGGIVISIAIKRSCISE